MCCMSQCIINVPNNMQVNMLFLGSSLYKVYQEKKRRLKFAAKEQSRYDIAWYQLTIQTNFLSYIMYNVCHLIKKSVVAECR